MKIAVIDGQGGGIGKNIVESIKSNINDDIEIIALGTNSIATSTMLKSGAHKGATGENAIKVMSNKVDIITGPIAILVANSMMGEISPPISEAISNSEAIKYLLPLNRCNINIAGIKSQKINDLIEDLINLIQEEIKKS